MKIGRQFGKRREKLERRMVYWKGPSVSRGNFPQVSGKETRAREVHPERTVVTLYRSVSPGDSMGADRAGVNRARVGVNVTTDEKKDKKQQWLG